MFDTEYKELMRDRKKGLVKYYAQLFYLDRR